MWRLLSLLALPFILLAMLVAPLMGIHFCPEEAIPLLTGAASLPFIGPLLRRRTKAHCCDKEHTSVQAQQSNALKPTTHVGLRTLSKAEQEESFEKSRAADNVLTLKHQSPILNPKD
jgi:hypothetical protein